MRGECRAERWLINGLGAHRDEPHRPKQLLYPSSGARNGLPVLFDTPRTSPRRLGLTGGTAVRESQLRSILRPEAVRPLPGPVARAEVRDRRACLEVSELPGPARERAQPDTVSHNRVCNGRRPCCCPDPGGRGRHRCPARLAPAALSIDDPRANLDRFDVRRRDPAEGSRLTRVFSAILRDVEDLRFARDTLTRRPPVLRLPDWRAWSASNRSQPHSRLDSSGPRVHRCTRPRTSVPAHTHPITTSLRRERNRESHCTLLGVAAHVCYHPA